MIEPGGHVTDAGEEPVARDSDAEELAQLAHQQRCPQAGEVADECRSGEEIGEETEAQDGCGEQDDTHEHRQDGARLEVLVGSGHRHRGKSRGGERGSPRVGADREVA